MIQGKRIANTEMQAEAKRGEHGKWYVFLKRKPLKLCVCGGVKLVTFLKTTISAFYSMNCESQDGSGYSATLHMETKW